MRKWNISDENKWKDHYWRNFESTVNAKLADWCHEREYRLILHSTFDDFDDKTKRRLKYKFSDLEGIIFGVATSFEDKARIADIIEQVCKAHGRKEFEFSQAYYTDRTGKIEVQPLALLKFE